MKSTLVSLVALAAGSSALVIPYTELENHLQPRQSCENTATSRDCWGEYSIDTNYYDTIPQTNNTVEVWLSVEYGLCAPDGYERNCMTFNGTIPGPAIIADWGDDLVIHVTNNMIGVNGTSIHWHGLRQLGTPEYDGVPGVSQCPIAPGSTMTYKYRVVQYGSTWYHSHLSLQYGDGLFGPMILNGPATADYDEDLGALFLQDWTHKTVFELWQTVKGGAPLPLDTGLINGTNTWDCTGSTDPNCVGGGKKFETVFAANTTYRLRIINVAIDGHFQFSIDGHKLKVIGNDLVPIVPYTTDSILVSIGQRYDVIVEANATPGDYWLRAGWVTACAANDNPANMTGIVRYNSSSTAEPTSTSTVVASSSCGDEPLASLVPHLKLNVTNIGAIDLEDLSFNVPNSLFQWTINSSSLYLDWANPTLAQVFNNESIFPTPYNVVSVNESGPSPEWAVLVIQDLSGLNLNHPIHLHGHDFWILAQTTGVFDGTTASFNTTNPPRRDVATLPGNGYLALAFQIDNPGAWLVHCHIAWHASQGLALEFVESQAGISIPSSDKDAFDSLCQAWDGWTPTEPYPQDDSGI